MHDPGDPVHDKNLSAGYMLCLVEDGDRVSYIPIAIQHPHSGCILSAQQPDDSQIRRLLNRCQLWLELLETRAEEFCPLILKIRTGELAHQYENPLRILWWRDAVHGLQIFEFRTVPLRGTLVGTAQNDNRHNDEQQNGQQPTDAPTSGIHKPSFASLNNSGKTRRVRAPIAWLVNRSA